MDIHSLSEKSTHFAQSLYELLALPRFGDSERVRISDVACSMALEHWDAARALFAYGLLPSALVVHRAQYEALVRSIWTLYAAPEEKLSKLAAELTMESEQAAKNMPRVMEMMLQISVKFSAGQGPLDYSVAIPYAEPRRYVASTDMLQQSRPEISALVLTGEAYEQFDGEQTSI